MRIQGDVTPAVLASIPGMQLTLLPFTVSPGDGVKYMTFGAMNNTQTQACITTAGVTIDQSPPTTSHPQSPSSNSVYTDTNLVLTWEDAIDTGV